MTAQLDLFPATPPPPALSGAVISDCGTYRYRLWRRWNDRPVCCFVMLNPSTANAEQDDPTIRRCIGYARGWGFGGLDVVNLFAFRATDPASLLAAHDPIDPENDRHLREAAWDAGAVVCAWGAYGRYLGRSEAVCEMLDAAGIPLRALKVTRGGEPGHPLYLRNDARLVPYSSPRIRTGGEK